MPPVEKRGPDHAIGRSRGGLTSKIHVVVDEHGLPVRLALTAGQASDKAPRLRCWKDCAALPSSSQIAAMTGSI